MEIYNLPSLGINSSFESHSVTITYPLKIHFVVIYRPPPGPLGDFLDELDVLLSTFPEYGTPLVMLGDFNVHLDKPQAADFHTLLPSQENVNYGYSQIRQPTGPYLHTTLLH